MKRRTFLTRGALAAGVPTVLGGCTERTLEDAESKPPLFDDRYHEEVDLPIRQKFEIVGEATRRADGMTFENLDEFRTYLDEEGLLLESLEETVEEGTRTLALEYVAEDSIARGLLYSLGVVAGGYASLVAGGYGADGLETSLHGSGGEKFGEFDIATEWAEQYLDGESTAAEYASTVGETLESNM